MSKPQIDRFGVILMSVTSALMGLPLYFGFAWQYALLLHVAFVGWWIAWGWLANSLGNSEQAFVLFFIILFVAVIAHHIKIERAQHSQVRPTADVDVTYYQPVCGNFRDIVGTWKTKRALWVIIRPNQGFYLSSVAAPRTPGADSNLAELPIGSEIRVSQLIEHEMSEGKPKYSVAGWARGLQCDLDPNLFVPNSLLLQTSTISTIPTWSVNPELLQQ